MQCPRCQQHNTVGRESCWNCGERLEASALDSAARSPEDAAAPRPESEADDASSLGELGPLRPGQGPQRAEYPVMSRVPQREAWAARRSRELMVRGTVGGALTGGAALGIVFGLLAASAADILETHRISPGATLWVSVAQGFVLGGVQGAIVGALSAYYGGGMWTGAKVGAALIAGMWLVQALLTGMVAVVILPKIAAAVLVLALAGAAIGALVGAVVESLAPPA